MLLFGGDPLDGGASAQAWLYDPTAHQWNLAAPMATARKDLLSARGGDLLLAGGGWQTDPFLGVHAVERYQLDGGWAAAGLFNDDRAGGVMVYRPSADGGTFVAVGGFPNGQNTIEASDGSGPWVYATQTSARQRHAVTVAPSGWLIVTGGCNASVSCTDVTVVPPGTLQSISARPMLQGRRNHSAVMVGQQVWVFGGWDPTGAAKASVEFATFSPADGGLSAWTSATAMIEPRADFAVAQLPDDRVLVTGGLLLDGGEIAKAELYNPANMTSTMVTDMTEPRAKHTATWIPDAGAAGRVLVFGGRSPGARPQLYDVALGRWCAAYPDAGS